MNSETFCRMPWTNLQVEQDGSFRPCCRINAFKTKRQLIYSEYQKSDEMSELRTSLLSGEKHAACERCWKDEETGNYSFRKIENRGQEQHIFSVNEEPGLKTIEIRLGNICNLTCRMCAPNYSSHWFEEVKRNPDIFSEIPDFQPYLRLQQFRFDLEEDRLKQLVQTMQSCQALLFSGGEPFLSKGLPVFLKSLIESGLHQNISVGLSTNVTVFNSEIWKALLNFKQISVSLSVDGVGPVNEYIRTHSKWDLVRQNLFQFKKLASSNCSLILAPTINVYSAFYIADLLRFYLNELYPIVELKSKFNFQTTPRWQSLSVLTRAMKEKIYSELSEFKNQNLPQNIEDFIGTLRLRMLATDFDQELFDQFQKYNASLDQVRNQSLQKDLPEFYSEMSVP
jgi:sulfatase maturation enzyme AslB (radical SAM superfamily)